jgi:uncharacterized protein (TIGR04255 family)
MQIPKRITPCPLVETLVEIRFDPLVPSDAIFGLIYGSLKDDYQEVEELPILQMPGVIREKEENLKFKPHYKLRAENIVVQIGPRVFSVSNLNDYIGWKSFYEKIEEAFQKVSGLRIIGDIFRLGLRYINFFEFDIFNKVNLGILLNNRPLESKQTILRTILPDGDFVHRLVMANKTTVNIHGENKLGSVIDIDTVLEKKITDFFEAMPALINEAHDKEKSIFFNLLKPEYLQQLNPEYE